MERSTLSLNNVKPTPPPSSIKKSSYSTVKSLNSNTSQPLPINNILITPLKVDTMKKDQIEENIELQSETDMMQSPSDDDNDVVIATMISPSPTRASIPQACSSFIKFKSLPRKFENLKIRELRNSIEYEIDNANLIKATTESYEDDKYTTPSAYSCYSCGLVHSNPILCCLSQSSSTATLTSSLSSLSPTTTTSVSLSSAEISDYTASTSLISQSQNRKIPIKTKSLDAHFLHNHHNKRIIVYQTESDILNEELAIERSVTTASKAISPQTDLCCGITLAKEQELQRKQSSLPKTSNSDNRPIYPNVPYSPYGSPYNSPRSNRRKTPLRESRRISIERSGSFLQLNQYKLMDQIGQISLREFDLNIMGLEKFPINIWLVFINVTPPKIIFTI
uniref:Uncharacterized protein n=1 Tax=Megaselia scalaris TaxID=36166 RepID=T1GHA7_MEGSC